MANYIRFGGTYSLDREEIDNRVSSGGGNYRLFKFDKRGNLVGIYVGRAADLNKRLKEHMSDSQRYNAFSVRYEPDEVERYRTECEEYHYWKARVALYNERHPDKPNGLSGRCRCPVCEQ